MWLSLKTAFGLISGVVIAVTAAMFGALGVSRAGHRVAEFDESYAAIPTATREHIDEREGAVLRSKFAAVFPVAVDLPPLCRADADETISRVGEWGRAAGSAGACGHKILPFQGCG